MVKSGRPRIVRVHVVHRKGASSSLVTLYIIPHVTKGAGTGTSTGTRREHE